MPVKKTAFSDDVRFVFVAGLEGTGHHSWGRFFSKLARRRRGWSSAPQAFRRQLFAEGRCSLFYGWPCTPSQWLALRASVVEDLRSLASAKREQGGGVVVLNLREDGNTGQMSYPNFYNSSMRPLSRPDLQVLADLAEEACVDLRVLVLARQAQKVYLSTTHHRHIDTPIRQTMTLLDNAWALSGELASIGADFYRCAELEPSVRRSSEEEVQQRRTLAAFIYPGSVAEQPAPNATRAEGGKAVKMKTAVKMMNKTVRVWNDTVDDTLSENEKVLVGRLAAATALINARGCSSQEHAAPLKKTRFADDVRFVFVAGLVGSGHGAVHAMYSQCQRKGGDFCQGHPGLSRLLTGGKAGAELCGLFNALACTEETWVNVRKAFVAELRKVRSETSLRGGGVVFLNFDAVSGLLGMSYPDPVGESWPLHRPDVHLLASLAEEAEVDLRILALAAAAPARILEAARAAKRSAGKGDGNNLHWTLTLSDNARALYGQLTSVDDHFVLCLPEPHPGAKAPWQSAAAAFSHPDFAGKRSYLWSGMVKAMEAEAAAAEASYAAHSTPSLYAGEQTLMRRIAGSTMLISERCQPVHS